MRLIGSVLRWWKLIAFYVIVGVVGSLLVSLTTPPVYRASTTLIVSQDSASADATDYTSLLTDEHLANTYALMLHGPSLLDSTIKALDLHTTRQELGKRIRISIVPNTQLVTLSVDDSSPERAIATTDELVREFVQSIHERDKARYATMRDSLQKELSTVQTRLHDTENELEKLAYASYLPDPDAPDRLEMELAQYRADYDSLLRSYQRVGLAEARTINGIVAAEAQASDQALRPQTIFDMFMAALVGLVLGVAMALLVERVDDRLRSAQEISDRVGLPTLGVLAEADHVENVLAAKPGTAPLGHIFEVFRTLRTNLQYARLDNPPSSILVSSPSGGEGKSVIALGLAISLAQIGKKVILVDGNLRRPILHEYMGVDNSAGLTTALLDAPGRAGAHCGQTSVPGLRLLAGGPLAPNPAELMQSQRMRDLFAELGAQADFLIVDTPSLGAGPDALLLSPLCDAALLVARIGLTRRGLLREASVSFAQAGTPALGVLLNRVPHSEAVAYYNADDSTDWLNRPARLVSGFIGRLVSRLALLLQAVVR
jgi:capsular exopolysaccharide synthesis family protein